MSFSGSGYNSYKVVAWVRFSPRVLKYCDVDEWFSHQTDILGTYVQCGFEPHRHNKNSVDRLYWLGRKSDTFVNSVLYRACRQKMEDKSERRQDLPAKQCVRLKPVFGSTPMSSSIKLMFMKCDYCGINEGKYQFKNGKLRKWLTAKLFQRF